MTKLRYEEFPPMSRRDMENAFLASDPEQVRVALYSAAIHERDWRWTQQHCLSFLQHENPALRWAAALSLSYIAVYQGYLDLDRVLPALRNAQSDPAISSIVEDSLETIGKFIRPK